MKVVATRTSYGSMKDAVKNTARIANLELGARVATQSKLLAPVDEGQLRNSLSASSLTETKELNDSTDKKADQLDTEGLTGDEVYVGSNSDHTIFQEYGTFKMVAKPFLRPAVELIIDRKEIETIFAQYSPEQMEIEMKKRKEKHFADIAKGAS